MSSTPPTAAVTDATGSVVSVPPEMSEALSLVVRIGGRDLLDRIVTLFFGSANERLQHLQQAVTRGDLTQVKRLAHAMKGSAAQVGAESLRAHAHDLEKEAEGMTLSDVAIAVERLASEVATAHGQLETARRQGVAE